MLDPSVEPAWVRRFSEAALQVGYRRALLACSSALFVTVLGSVQLLLWASGQPAQWPVLLGAAVPSLFLAPWLASVGLRLVFQLDAARQRHTVLSTQDELTGAHNRRHFMQVVEREWARCRRYSEDGAVLLVVADHFRTLKESQGRPCCDAMLRDITRVVTHALRQPDLLARYGGEALIVYLPNTDPLGALDVAERIRERVATHSLRWQDNTISTTVSIGVASVGAAHLTLDALVHDATTALQAARAAGHNCVRAAPIQPRAVPVRPPAAGGVKGPPPTAFGRPQ